MDDFTEETGIKTDIQITPWKDYWTMLEAATTGGNMPDVILDAFPADRDLFRI